jgi:hypothetical protein
MELRGSNCGHVDQSNLSSRRDLAIIYISPQGGALTALALGYCSFAAARLRLLLSYALRTPVLPCRVSGIMRVAGRFNARINR